MRFVIYGAGGIGGTIGARLHQAGFDVTLIARGAHFAAIAKDGLRFVSPSQDVRLEIDCVEHPAGANIAPDDAV
ncbi:MAG: ketopantoate reductase family protein, partial [Gammaproteobacteria bacterium]|nr:ketopantoate reductase family protein [Gammaproteobacteria bacterium]